MGLFSFLKNAGNSVLKDREAEKRTEMAENSAAREVEMNNMRLDALNTMVGRSGANVTDLSLDLDGDKVTVYGQTESQSDKEKVILALGNVDGIGSVDDRISVVNVEPEAQFYEVKGGDSLSKIAKHFYGDPMKYQQIFEANQPMLEDPNKIYPGQTLRIPNL